MNELKQRPGIPENSGLYSAYAQLRQLIAELQKKTLPDPIVAQINREIEELNALSDTDKQLGKSIRNKQSALIRLLEKELKIVPRNHYRNTWLALGMAVFGIPLGVALGASLGNMAFLGIGLPLGMVIGMSVGAGMDKKAGQEGRQLDIEIKP